GGAHRRAAAGEPRHRHHQGHRARHRRIAARTAGPRAERHGDRRQSLAAHARGRALPRLLRAARGREPLARAQCRPGRGTPALTMGALQLFLDNFANWDSFVRIWPLLWQGLQLTVLLSVVTVPIAIAVGLLIAVAYSFHHKWINLALLVWIDL